MRKWTKLETKFEEVEDHNSQYGNDKKAMKFHNMIFDCIGEKKNVKSEVIFLSFVLFSFIYNANAFYIKKQVLLTKLYLHYL